MPYSPFALARTNLHPNPNVVNASGFNSTTTQCTISYGVAEMRFTFTITGSIAMGFNSAIPMVSGQSYRIMVRARCNKTLGVRLRVLNGQSPYFRLSLDFAWYEMTVVAGTGAVSQTGLLILSGEGHAVGDWIEIDRVLLISAPDTGNHFSGATPDNDLELYSWSGTPNASSSTYETRTFTPGPPIRPVPVLSISDVLYNDRTTTYRWEVLQHDAGLDKLIGVLDGVAEGSLRWTQNAAVKGSGSLSVLDLATAQAGLLRISDLSLASVRLRPVCLVAGLPENPLGTYLVSAATEDWTRTGRVWSLELLDRCTVPSQDVTEGSYAVAAGTLILQQVRTLLGTSGEFVAIDESSTKATSTGMVWEAGTSKLSIINDLLDVANYNALWIDGFGNFQMTPRVLPADRSLTYDLLGIPRELVDGAQSIYATGWTRERDSFEVPNKVIAIQAAAGADAPAIIGTWTNTDPASPYSFAARGRWIPYVIDSVECPAGTAGEILAFLQKRAQTTLVQMSAVQAQVKIEHLPIPVRVSDVLRFANAKAGINTRHVITSLELETVPTGLMNTTLQEVIAL